MGINFLKRALLRLFVRSGMTPRLAVLSFFLPALFFFSCSRGSEDPGELLTAYCIRQCVIETSDPEICDTKCRCAVKKLEEGASAEELAGLVSEITEDRAHVGGLEQKFNAAFEACPGIK